MTNGDFKPALNDLVKSVPVVVGDQRWDVYVLGLSLSGPDWLVHAAVIGPDSYTFTIPVPRTLTVRAIARTVLDSVVDRMVDKMIEGANRASHAAGDLRL